jgi:hypothetical protein
MCSDELFWVLIFYFLAVDFQRVLAIPNSLNITEHGMCYLTTTRELTTTIEELFTFTITSDTSSPSTIASTPPIDYTITSSSVSALSVFSSHPSVSSTPSNSPSGYVFNPQSTENVAVYFGQTDATSSTSLAKQCADQNIDIVILAFVVSRNSSGGLYPGVNFGAACGGQTSLMEEEAPGLLTCPELATDINTCQVTYGKKVLLSVGGGGQSITFNTAADASAFGSILWDLFGPPGNVDINLRPFGDVSIDGFDIGKTLTAFTEILLTIV